MLKKGQPIKFKRPESSMARVLRSIENGHITLFAIRKETGLTKGQVAAAVANLAYIGAICTRMKDEQGRAVYILPGTIQGFAPCLKGVRSIFDARI